MDTSSHLRLGRSWRRALPQDARTITSARAASGLAAEIEKHTVERAAMGVVPLPLNAAQAADLVELLKAPPAGEEAFLMDQLENRIPPGVDEAAYVKVPRCHHPCDAPVT